MDRTPPRGGGRSRNRVFDALANGRRRATIRVLDRISPLGVEEAATHLVAEETGEALVDVSRPQVERALVDLRHGHLPKLEEAGLVQRERGEVRLTRHPALEDPKIRRMVEADAEDWNRVMSALAHKRRRIALAALYRHGAPMDRTELAVEVARKVRENDDGEASVEDVLVGLHHQHLPFLEDATLASYDADAETVEYVGHPGLDEEWLVEGAEDTPRAILSMADHSEDIWSLEGRDNVTERGRALCESAEEELFMMFTVEGTVETACVRRIQDALERGVDVFLGTQNSELRHLVREHAPEVVIWEPQLDWLNLPPNREKVGRLIMADRNEIMVGTIGDESGGVPTETAITGVGEDNPLVMLLREMLGSRLDHLDAQSEDFRSHIPL